MELTIQCRNEQSRPKINKNIKKCQIFVYCCKVFSAIDKNKIEENQWDHDHEVKEDNIEKVTFNIRLHQ